MGLTPNDRGKIVSVSYTCPIKKQKLKERKLRLKIKKACVTEDIRLWTIFPEWLANFCCLGLKTKKCCWTTDKSEAQTTHPKHVRHSLTIMPVPRCVTQEQRNAVTYWVLGKNCRTVCVGTGAVQWFTLLVWKLSLSHSPHRTYPELVSRYIWFRILNILRLLYWNRKMSWERALWTNKYPLISIRVLISLRSLQKEKDLLTDYLFCGFFKLSFKQEWSHKLKLRTELKFWKHTFRKICIFHFLFSYNAQLTCEL